jgi:ADP-ribose pyrophosphatase YjhB (NUDIX family)
MNWLEIAQKVQAIAQAGLTYSKDPYDIERFEMLRKLSIEIVSDHTGIDEPIVKKLFADEVGYPTPKVDVRAGIFRDNKILLVKETQDGKWSLPGGWADIGDSPKEVVEREVKEEAGYIVEAVKLVAVLDKSRHAHPPSSHYTYKLFFLCRDLNKRVKSGIETSEFAFFSLDQLPELSPGRTAKSQIEMLFNHHFDETLPTEFD